MVSILCVYWINMAAKSYPSCAPGCSRKQKKKDPAGVQFQHDRQQPKPVTFNIQPVTAPGSTSHHL